MKNDNCYADLLFLFFSKAFPKSEDNNFQEAIFLYIHHTGCLGYWPVIHQCQLANCLFMDNLFIKISSLFHFLVENVDISSFDCDIWLHPFLQAKYNIRIQVNFSPFQVLFLHTDQGRQRTDSPTSIVPPSSIINVWASCLHCDSLGPSADLIQEEALKHLSWLQKLLAHLHLTSIE